MGNVKNNRHKKHNKDKVALKLPPLRNIRHHYNYQLPLLKLIVHDLGCLLVGEYILIVNVISRWLREANQLKGSL